MRIIFKKIIFTSAALYLFASAGFCQAAFLKDGVTNKIGDQVNFSADAYDKSADVFALTQNIINAFLSIIGVILLIYLLYAGYKWMTAYGEEEKVEQAKDTIKRAITGIIIIVAAYAISIFVMGRLEAGALKGGASQPATGAPATEMPEQLGGPEEE